MSSTAVASEQTTARKTTAVPGSASVLDVVAAYASPDKSGSKPFSTASLAARELMREVIKARQNHELRMNKEKTMRSKTLAPASATPADEAAAAIAADALPVAVVPSTSRAAEPMTLVVATSEEDMELEEESVVLLLREARESYERAEELLDLGLTQCEDWLSLRDRFYDAGALFAISGRPTESARCLLSAAFINRAFGDEDEAITTLNVSAESLKVEQPDMAVEVLERLVECYDRVKLQFQSAKCLRDAAMIVDERLEDRPRAIALFTRAVDAYDHKMPTEGKMVGMQRSLREPCFERLCFLHIEEGHYDVAEKMFMEKARQRPAFAPTTRFYMCALLCIFARGGADEDAFFDSLYIAKKRFEALQYEDRGLQKGKEQLLLKAVVEAFENNSLNQFDLAWMTYKSYKTTIPSAAMDVIMAQIRQNLYDHLERYSI